MTDLDTRVWIDSARRYARLCRRWVWFQFATPAVFFGFLPLAGLLDDRLAPTAVKVLWGLLLAVAAVCWFGLLATGLAAYRFRCPRCGNRFAFPSSAWPTNHCKHCNFDLGPASMA